ncbi:MAG: helix-turn-helix domain-containing protein [Sporichthyaceae bacterium]|nr:helix-turn-helix domain-containing protein [Sporichthyaceae bacterium]
MTDLATAGGIRRHHVWMWEAGVFSPSPASLAMLGAALDVDPLELVAEIDIERPTVYELRLRAGLGRRELGEQIGVTRRTVYNLEHGEPVRLDDAMLRLLAKALGVSLTDATAAVARSRLRLQLDNPDGEG